MVGSNIEIILILILLLVCYFFYALFQPVVLSRYRRSWYSIALTLIVAFAIWIQLSGYIQMHYHINNAQSMKSQLAKKCEVSYAACILSARMAATDHQWKRVDGFLEQAKIFSVNDDAWIQLSLLSQINQDPDLTLVVKRVKHWLVNHPNDMVIMEAVARRLIFENRLEAASDLYQQMKNNCLDRNQCNKLEEIKEMLLSRRDV